MSVASSRGGNDDVRRRARHFLSAAITRGGVAFAERRLSLLLICANYPSFRRRSQHRRRETRTLHQVIRVGGHERAHPGRRDPDGSAGSGRSWVWWRVSCRDCLDVLDAGETQRQAIDLPLWPRLLRRRRRMLMSFRNLGFPSKKEERREKAHNGIQPRRWIVNEVCARLRSVI